MAPICRERAALVPPICQAACPAAGICPVICLAVRICRATWAVEHTCPAACPVVRTCPATWVLVHTCPAVCPVVLTCLAAFMCPDRLGRGGRLPARVPKRRRVASEAVRPARGLAEPAERVSMRSNPQARGTELAGKANGLRHGSTLPRGARASRPALSARMAGWNWLAR